MASRYKEFYKNEVAPKLMKETGYKNVHQIPKLSKIVINMGLGEATSNSKIIEQSMAELAKIAGQKPVVAKAKKSIAAFKLKENQEIGCFVTLRSEKMYDFFDKLINIALPRVRDFKGLSKKSFDGYGNYTFGVKEQVIFPEISYELIDKIKGMNITIVTTAKNNDDGYKLLKGFNFPFRN
ncbi:MAG: 50S ribosomal protein L5 [Deltaproteobacteria bacterium]|nr:50S ribosomal protein L5 [Deltaproteobacteria bacterium]MCL5879324.1 50S ribosomal protein L5 [Deltaproteobacteria bacterium]MDA8304590.1 50S ribosomal protein L5 [Deltaproteobacteria bacterium]